MTRVHRVSEGLHRSGQPTAAELRALAHSGLRTVVNLRFWDTDKSKLKGTGLAYVHIPMLAWLPREKDVKHFLRVVTDRTKLPVLVHCRVGADRTGMMVAAYRVIVQGWTKADAIAEMTRGGFGFNPLWKTLVYRIRRMNTDQLRRELGVSWPGTGAHDGTPSTPSTWEPQGFKE